MVDASEQTVVSRAQGREPFARAPARAGLGRLADPLPLGRTMVDRDAVSRGEESLVPRLLAQERTRVVVARGSRIAARGDGERLVRLTGSEGTWVRDAMAERTGEEPEWAYLGRDGAHSYLALLVRGPRPDPVAPEHVDAHLAEGALRLELPPGAGTGVLVPLREVGHALDAADAGLACAAVALARWRRRYRRCPACGTPNELVEAGWAARCPREGTIEYPRTDAAVIMALHDGAGRILLARSVSWPERRRSVVAGFVEAGESLVAAVRREVAEETGLRVGEVRYAGEQPWPVTSSLMVAFHAWLAGAEPGGAGVRGAVPDPVPDGVEVTDAAWFTRDQLAAAVRSGEVVLPMETSIARALIESWYGGALPECHR